MPCPLEVAPFTTGQFIKYPDIRKSLSANPDGYTVPGGFLPRKGAPGGNKLCWLYRMMISLGAKRFSISGYHIIIRISELGTSLGEKAYLAKAAREACRPPHRETPYDIGH